MRLVCGVGVNDAGCSVTSGIDGKRQKDGAYCAWASMLNRCYSPKYQREWPTYIGVTVCEQWHRFSNFKRWYDEHYVDGWHLDKDLLTDSREYGPSTCLFVPQWLNKFTTDSGANRGEFPVGVNLDKKHEKFRSQCHNPITKRREYLGLFPSADLAYRAWLDRKVELAYQLKDLMDAIDRRIYFRVVEMIFTVDHRK